MRSGKVVTKRVALVGHHGATRSSRHVVYIRVVSYTVSCRVIWRDEPSGIWASAG